MIADARPLKTMAYVRPSWDSPTYRVSDAFDYHTRETVDVDGLYVDDDDRPFLIAESCAATWFEKDGTLELDALTGLNTWERRREVRCMEVATWYVSIPIAGGGGSYCHFHKPRVVSL